MLLFFLLIIAFISIVVLISLFAPQRLPWYRPHLILNPSEIEAITIHPFRKQPVIIEGLAQPEPENDPDISLTEKIDRLENILAEKNMTIEKLQKQLSAEKSHRLEFENVKGLLDEEIQKLRLQNKELKIRIGEET